LAQRPVSSGGRSCPDAEIGWQQRFSNDQKSLAQLETFLEPPVLNDREQQGLIKGFETTFELAWNPLRELLGSRDTLREAFRLGLLSDGETWMLMMQVRNLTRHTYNCSTADEIATNIAPALSEQFSGAAQPPPATPRGRNRLTWLNPSTRQPPFNRSRASPLRQAHAFWKRSPPATR
jgi:nucleotidyltransferase substrate binding protein (TIGR01987 family)